MLYFLYLYLLVILSSLVLIVSWSLGWLADLLVCVVLLLVITFYFSSLPAVFYLCDLQEPPGPWRPLPLHQWNYFLRTRPAGDGSAQRASHPPAGQQHDVRPEGDKMVAGLGRRGGAKRVFFSLIKAKYDMDRVIPLPQSKSHYWESLGMRSALLSIPGGGQTFDWRCHNGFDQVMGAEQRQTD